MTDASARAREILDAIERDAVHRQAALDDELPPLAGPATLLREPAVQSSVPLPPLAAAAPLPTFTLPPVPAVASPIVAPVPPPSAPVHELPAALRGHVMAPVTQETPATAPAAAEPPTHEAARLLALVDHVVAQTKHAQQRLHTLDAAVTALSRRLGVDDDVDESAGSVATPEATPAVSTRGVSGREDPEPSERVAAVPAVSPPPAAPRPAAGRTDGARLVAIEMAVGGFSRGEVRDRLVREYGLREPDGILDDVFGADSDADSRMPWGAV